MIPISASSISTVYKLQFQHNAEQINNNIKRQLQSRAVRSSNELRNAALLVLRGQRHGRRYIVPGTGRVKYYRRNTKAIGLKYNRRKHTASYIYEHAAGTGTISYRHYTASAPGEPPAVRTGAFRNSWHPRSYWNTVSGGGLRTHSEIQSNITTKNGQNLGDMLENGTRKMAPRSYKDKVRQKAMPAIKRIYNEPFRI